MLYTKNIPSFTWYLQNTKKTKDKVFLPEHLSILNYNNMDFDEFMQWYRDVGGAWLWTSHLHWTEKDYSEFLTKNDIRFLCMYSNNTKAGFVGYVLQNDVCEIKYFGLMPAYIGKGIAGIFMRYTLQHIWHLEIEKIWLHTCEWDHASALDFYLKMGFEVYDTKVLLQGVTEDWDLENHKLTYPYFVKRLAP